MEEGLYIVEALLSRSRERMICVRHVDDCKRDLISRLCMNFSVYTLIVRYIP